MIKACEKIHPINSNTVEPLFRGHPRDQGKCPSIEVSPEWRLGRSLLTINHQTKDFSFILPRNLLQSLFQAVTQCITNHDKHISAILCVEFPQVRYIDLRVTVHVVKAVVIMISV